MKQVALVISALTFMNFRLNNTEIKSRDRASIIRLRHIFTILLSVGGPALFSQNLELIGGINKNVLFDYDKTGEHFNSI